MAAAGPPGAGDGPQLGTHPAGEGCRAGNGIGDAVRIGQVWRASWTNRRSSVCSAFSAETFQELAERTWELALLTGESWRS